MSVNTYSSCRYLRPAHQEPGRILCVDAFPINAHGVQGDTHGFNGKLWSTSPRMLTCNSMRPSQQWTYDARTKRFRNGYTGMCMEPSRLNEGEYNENGWEFAVLMRVCKDKMKPDKNHRIELVPYDESKLPKIWQNSGW